MVITRNGVRIIGYFTHSPSHHNFASELEQSLKGLGYDDIRVTYSNRVDAMDVVGEKGFFQFERVKICKECGKDI